ncbi:zonular occludens toxin domain-containing protein [Sulfurimonas sp.]|uniref:zonular occludens toxin domain-containing protein n=1 Tax=Sulfurimonas sp. TaxID=2022749 RepID=UPI0026157CDF|nr:zonular occludens toxin domain-containing protein [Sulfurimonas sp.]MDD5157782.1 zonular occludens toxin domain-containing protein [Sulfurimonas sp.]
MIEYYTGVPGSGKTYNAVNHAYNCFIDSSHKQYGKYKNFYTNINEFNFEFFNDNALIASKSDKKQSLLKSIFSSIKTPSINKNHFFTKEKKLIPNESALASDTEVQSVKKVVAYNLEIDKLLESFTILHTLYLEKADDSVLIEKSRELNILDTLFIIDECHNYFSDSNTVLIWWLSYHRHLHQDIILITQNFSLVNRKYLTFGEFFYKAVASSLRVRSSVFTYHQYINYHLYKNAHSDTIKVNFRASVYALYSSGANTQSKKVIYKYIFIAVVLLAVVFLVFNMIISRFSHANDDSKKATLATNSKNINAVQSPILNSPAPQNINNVDSFSVVCVENDCISNNQRFSVTDLVTYTSKYGLTQIGIDKLCSDVFIRSYSKNEKFQKEVLNVSLNIPANN